MRLSQSLPGVCLNRFRTSRWSAVQSRSSDYKEAFAELCKLYWYPLYGFMGIVWRQKVTNCGSALKRGAG